jgi:hypothetical protein
MIWEVDETLDSTVGWDEFSLAYRYSEFPSLILRLNLHSMLASVINMNWELITT